MALHRLHRTQGVGGVGGVIGAAALVAPLQQNSAKGVRVVLA